MRIAFTGLLLLSVRVYAQESPPVLEYQLELFENKIHVELLYHPTEKDSSSFTYGQPMFGGQKDIFSGLQHVEVDSSAQHFLPSPPGIPFSKANLNYKSWRRTSGV